MRKRAGSYTKDYGNGYTMRIDDDDLDDYGKYYFSFVEKDGETVNWESKGYLSEKDAIEAGREIMNKHQGIKTSRRKTAKRVKRAFRYPNLEDILSLVAYDQPTWVQVIGENTIFRGTWQTLYEETLEYHDYQVVAMDVVGEYLRICVQKIY